MQYPANGFAEYFTHITERLPESTIITGICQCCLRVIAHAPTLTALEIAELAHFKTCADIAREQFRAAD